MVVTNAFNPNRRDFPVVGWAKTEISGLHRVLLRACGSFFGGRKTPVKSGGTKRTSQSPVPAVWCDYKRRYSFNTKFMNRQLSFVQFVESSPRYAGLAHS